MPSKHASSYSANSSSKVNLDISRGVLCVDLDVLIGQVAPPRLPLARAAAHAHGNAHRAVHRSGVLQVLRGDLGVEGERLPLIHEHHVAQHHAQRPQLGSWPKMAALVRLEQQMDRATVRASSSVAAPMTVTSTSAVAPSPSQAMALHMPVSTAFTAASRRLPSSESASVMVAFPAAPDARAMTVSLVEVSPSREIWLKVSRMERRSMPRQASGDTAASHVSTPSIVA